MSWPAPRCLRELYDRFGAGGFLAAYNAGPSRYLTFLTARPTAEGETRLYLAKLARLLPEGRRLAAQSRPRPCAGLAQRTAVCRKLAVGARLPLRGPTHLLPPFRRQLASNAQSVRRHRVSHRTPLACSPRSRPR